MKSGIIFVAGVIGFCSLGTAFASDLTFSVLGSFTDGASLSGTLSIDTVSGVVDSNGLNLDVIGGDAGSPGLVFDILQGTSVYNYGTGNLFLINALDSFERGPNLQLELNIGAATTLAGYTGGSLCYVPSGFPTGYPNGDNCGYYYSSYSLSEDPELIGGSVSSASAPEPASILLLAGPALWLVRRRYRRA